MTRAKLLGAGRMTGLAASVVLAAGLVLAGAGPAAAAGGVSVDDVTLHQDGGDTAQVVGISGPIIGTSGTLVVKVAEAAGLRDYVFEGYNSDSLTGATCTEPVAGIALFEVDCTSSAWVAGDLNLYFRVGGGEEGPVLVTSCAQNPITTTTAEYAGDSATRVTATAVDVDCADAPPAAAATTNPPPKPKSTPAAATPTPARSHAVATTAPAASSAPALPVGDGSTEASATSPTAENPIPADAASAAPVLVTQQTSSAAHASSFRPVIGIAVLVLAVFAAGWLLLRRRRMASAATEAAAEAEAATDAPAIAGEDQEPGQSPKP